MTEKKESGFTNYVAGSRLFLAVVVIMFSAFLWLTSNHTHDNYITVREMDAVIQEIRELRLQIVELITRSHDLNSH